MCVDPRDHNLEGECHATPNLAKVAEESGTELSNQHQRAAKRKTAGQSGVCSEIVMIGLEVANF